MIALARLILVALFAIIMFVFGCGYCLLSPRNPKHVFTFGRIFGAMHRLFGLKLELRLPDDAYERGQHIYIGNHQNSWDLFTISSAVTPNVVSLGKKSLLWIPLFGQLYWLTGNILIDRDNKAKAKGTIDLISDEVRETGLSVWMFPEGTRSRGRGLMPFKAGAFHAAIGAEVNIIPIVCSTTQDKIKLNRWNNGHVIVEMLSPVDVSQWERSQVKKLASHCRELMKDKLAQLDQEVAERNQADGVEN